MPKFRIPVVETSYGYVEIEADTKEEAIDEAYCLPDSYTVRKSNVEVIKQEIEIL